MLCYATLTRMRVLASGTHRRGPRIPTRTPIQGFDPKWVLYTSFKRDLIPCEGLCMRRVARGATMCQLKHQLVRVSRCPHPRVYAVHLRIRSVHNGLVVFRAIYLRTDSLSSDVSVICLIAILVLFV